MLKEPLSCFFSSCLSLILIGSTLIAFAIIMSVNFLPKIMKESIESKTGFYVNEYNFKYDIFSNTTTINNLTLMNPTKYSKPVFVTVPTIKIKANPLKLVMGKYDMSELELHISELICLRQNSKDYNLNEFIKLSKDIFESDNGHLKKLSFSVDKFTYEDVSGSETMFWTSTAPIKYEAENIEDLSKTIREIGELFNAQKASYISESLKQISEK